MKYLKKSTNDWLIFFNNLNSIIKEHRDIVNKTIVVLKRFKNNELTNITNEYQVINLLTNIGIEDIEIALTLLNTIRDFYNYDKLIQEIKDIRELYVLTNLAFIYDNNNLINTYEYFTLDHYRKVFTAANSIPFKTFNLNTNGLNNISFKANNFIIDELDLSNSTNNDRTFYTTNFRLNTKLPTKNDISLFSINYERFKLFKDLIKSLLKYPLVNLIITDPNITFINNYTKTIRADGLILDENNNELIPKESFYLTTKTIKVRNANFCLIYDINTKEIFLYINNTFYEEVIKDIETKNILDNFIKSKENILNLDR